MDAFLVVELVKSPPNAALAATSSTSTIKRDTSTATLLNQCLINMPSIGQGPLLRMLLGKNMLWRVEDGALA